jgi:cystathionine beta-lyase family protein involved in aluminum resistance
VFTPELKKMAKEAEKLIHRQFESLEETRQHNFQRVLLAMQKNRLSDHHFQWNTGYGYNDMGREVVESIYADLFGADEAIVRPQIVNGTHALSICLTALLRPGHHMISVTGTPYDTLKETIGIGIQNGSSLTEYGVTYSEIDLTETGDFDLDAIYDAIKPQTRMIYIQRSSGYSYRKAIRLNAMESLIKKIKRTHPEIIVMVDNCYGEFIEDKEPTHIGVDILAGSLIKNPGGGMALTGGYIVGRHDLITLCAHKLTAPGIGKECGLTFGQNRSVLQGLFIAPEVVTNALKGALFTAQLFQLAGYDVVPTPQDLRSDIIQSVLLKSPEKVMAFCKGIQMAAPVDAHVTPLPWDMPGYDCPVIMAAGAFVQGSSIELSADAPMREPYAVYFQGGLTYDHSKFGAMMALKEIESVK